MLSPIEQYWQGFTFYCDGLPLSACATNAQRRGWWAANRAEGAAVAGVYND